MKWIALEPGRYAISAAQVQALLETRIAVYPQIMADCGYTAQEVGERRVGELVMAVGCVVGATYTGDMDDVLNVVDSTHLVTLSPCHV